MVCFGRCAVHQAGHDVVAVRLWLPLRELVINDNAVLVLPPEAAAQLRSWRERRSPLRGEHEGRVRLMLALEPPQGSQLVTEDRMRAGRALLDAADVHERPEWRSINSEARRPCR